MPYSGRLAERPAHVPADRVVDFDMFAPPRVEQDFQASWKSLQAPGIADLVWTPRQGGHWIVTSGRMIKDMFVDYERFSNRVPVVPKEEGELIKFIPQTIDPPQHRDYRLLINSSLAPKIVSRIEARVRNLAVDLIQGFRARGHCNFTAEYAEVLPIHIFLSIVDLPLEDAPKLTALANHINRPDGSMSLAQAVKGFEDYLGGWIDRRTGGTGEDLLSRLINGRVDGRAVTRDEALKMCNLVLLAGLDTVVNFLGFAMLFLARSPAHRRQLRERPELLPAAVDELLRRYPVVCIAREVTRDMEYEGVLLKKGDMIMIPTMLHGLDERENERPLEVDFHRASADHSTFGGGVHRCAGSFLARAEIRITLEEWLSRIPDFSVAPGWDVRHAGGVVGGVEKLPLVWDAAQ